MIIKLAENAEKIGWINMEIIKLTIHLLAADPLISVMLLPKEKQNNIYIFRFGN
ncbi:MAG: hypothetical protein H7250_05585 [Flavobacterium sp.]|nr:hypothetical protein [Flavobacterium sp.]